MSRYRHRRRPTDEAVAGAQAFVLHAVRVVGTPRPCPTPCPERLHTSVPGVVRRVFTRDTGHGGIVGWCVRRPEQPAVNRTASGSPKGVPSAGEKLGGPCAKVPDPFGSGTSAPACWEGSGGLGNLVMVDQAKGHQDGHDDCGEEGPDCGQPGDGANGRPCVGREQ